MIDQTAELMYKAALPIDQMHIARFPDDSVVFVLWVDLSERADLAVALDQLASQVAMGKQHDQKQVDRGYTICTWFARRSNKQNMTIGLRIELRPTRLVFHLAWNVERQLRNLETLAKHGKLWILPGPCPDQLSPSQCMDMNTFIRHLTDSAGPGLMVELEPRLLAELQQLLQGWRNRP